MKLNDLMFVSIDFKIIFIAQFREVVKIILEKKAIVQIANCMTHFYVICIN